MIHDDVHLIMFRYGRWVTRRVAVASIASVWLLAATVSFVPISLGLHRSEDSKGPAPTYNDGSQVKKIFTKLF